MIATLSGEVLEVGVDHLVVTLGGLGLRVFVPAPLIAQVRVGEYITLHTHLVVREDLLALYGFETRETREFFTLLLGVNGVGPRIALAILSVLSTDAIRRAVVNEQADIFSRVPGVGKKTAQKILLHLQGKVSGEEQFAAMSPLTDIETEVIGALTALGYSVIEAQTALQAIPKDAPMDVEARLRLALQYFSS
ncbi:MAG TPA: Holliday junction branch migration protein RuvA [Anaerolineaceae bacterium]|nr:Holliday junction branch migration protein RuvA [Anaerolineaceae bacterium]